MTLYSRKTIAPLESGLLSEKNMNKYRKVICDASTVKYKRI